MKTFNFIFIVLFFPCSFVNAQNTCDKITFSGEVIRLTNSQRRFDMIVNSNLEQKFYLFQSPELAFSWINSDPFNNNKTNYAFGTFIDLFTKIPFILDNDKYKKYAFILSLPNSKHNIFLSELFDSSGFCNEIIPQLGFLGSSIFFKVNTDYYLFRNTKWLSFTPSLGFSFYLFYPYFEIGWFRNYGYDFKETKTNNGLFFTIGLMGRND